MVVVALGGDSGSSFFIIMLESFKSLKILLFGTVIDNVDGDEMQEAALYVMSTKSIEEAMSVFLQVREGSNPVPFTSFSLFFFNPLLSINACSNFDSIPVRVVL